MWMIVLSGSIVVAIIYLLLFLLAYRERDERRRARIIAYTLIVTSYAIAVVLYAIIGVAVAFFFNAMGWLLLPVFALILLLVRKRYLGYVGLALLIVNVAVVTFWNGTFHGAIATIVFLTIFLTRMLLDRGNRKLLEVIRETERGKKAGVKTPPRYAYIVLPLVLVFSLLPITAVAQDQSFQCIDYQTLSNMALYIEGLGLVVIVAVFLMMLLSMLGSYVAPQFLFRITEFYWSRAMMGVEMFVIYVLVLYHLSAIVGQTGNGCGTLNLDALSSDGPWLFRLFYSILSVAHVV